MSKKAAIYIILGQSNAVGHGIPMEKRDLILTPMKNVFGLHRKDNQSFTNTHLTFSGYTSFGMNLAEEQDNTYSIPNCLASQWQNHIDKGNRADLPDLYLVQIAIGSQGVTQPYMWHPTEQKTLIPGTLGTVNISLFPFTLHILKLLGDYFASQNMDYEIIRLDWRGGENEMFSHMDELTTHLKDIYKTMFDQFNQILDTPPITLHKLVCHDCASNLASAGNGLENMYFINDVFSELEKEYGNITVFDPTTAPQFVNDVYGNGIFLEDAIHFTPEVNQWIAEGIFQQYCNR